MERSPHRQKDEKGERKSQDVVFSVTEGCVIVASLQTEEQCETRSN